MAVVLGVGRSLVWTGVVAFVVFVLFAAYQASTISNSPPVFRTWQSTISNFVYGAWNASPATSAPFFFNSRSIIGGVQMQRLEDDGVKGKKRRVAICLVGAARAFELSGGSLKKYLLDASTDADVFLHSPLDKDSYKFLMLKGVSNLTAAHIFIPQQLPESDLQRQVLTGANSPNGIQGLLQYFNLVEGCLHMIEKHEMQHNITYGWIIRTRVDGYWNGQVPALESLDPTFYYVPSGSQYGGLNDRFGMGNANTSRAALARLSLLPLLHSRGLRLLNSETAFKAQLVESQIPFKFLELPFCILTTRKYSWPPAFWGVPVTSITTKGPLNGSKCRPCTPRAMGPEAQAVVDKLSKGWGWPGFIEGLQLCDAQGDWERHWERFFPKRPGFDVSLDMIRMQNMTLASCIQEIEDFQQQWEVWDAPPAKIICEQRLS
ncbi:hypothetical protein BDL97_08G066000 [Sphagnum fallax]|nr:hypothetical protein BDL97_08G066000 [Sphagnum fallax]KAH8954180.1 hypothetical protein BDL97_08G066000 [Sphagnum fallax]KAH8954181.1 hypothetical protein BDL97_08G066000 [Sphagnum fallax]